ncbi:hypothetical protein M3147_09840 [Agromyces mediolanus]|uniref:hypothetical protein n=1 Tax=Agromyces mediolanus TaxID=41986 RepID=UPI002042301B|nr:hypothetical protein [Agromyces mediolanus]MCM3657551.1 hypothetical protein [Agromyces mediolanus]
MLRNEVARSVVVPVSAGLLTDIAAYHAALIAYRAGDPKPIVEQVGRLPRPLRRLSGVPPERERA